MKDYFCYILKNEHEPDINRTYNGFTTDPKKRIRQHNQEIKGGAKYTKKWGNKSWEIYVLIKGFPDKINALQCEWRIKKPTGHRIRPRIYNTPEGRIKGLNEILKMDKWTSKSNVLIKEIELKIWILKEYSQYLDLDVLPENIVVCIVDHIDLNEL